MLYASILVLVHLVGFAAFVGAAFAQQELLKRSGRAGDPKLRDAYERMCAAIVTKIELPALIVQILTGVALLAHEPAYMTQRWIHYKLTAILALLVLSHVEMFNARKIVRARAERGDEASAEIADRKKRHAMLGVVGTIFVVVVLVCATVLRRMA